MTDIDEKTQQVVQAIDWKQLCLEYINANLEPSVGVESARLTLKVLAEKHGVKYGTLRNRASEEDWNGQLALMRAANREAVKDHLVNLTLQSEIEIRTRQVNYGRLAQDIAMERLLQIDPQTLTAKETLEMLRLGTELERKAAGIDEEYTAPPQTSLRDNQTREAVRQTLSALEMFRIRMRAKLNAPNPA